MGSAMMRTLCLVFCLVVVDSTNPGFKARVTKNGLQYASQVAVEALKYNLNQLRIPDQSGETSGVKYAIKNIRVTSFTLPSSAINIVPGKGLQWTTRGVGIAMAANFHYKKLFISDSGSLDASLSGINFDLGIDIGEDTNGRPTLKSRDCSAVISRVHIDFHGSMSWLYNLVKGYFEKLLRSLLNKQLCQIIVKEIDTDANKQLAKLQVTVPLGDKFQLDYRLLSAPQFTKDYFETLDKGQISWSAAPGEVSPLVAPSMPEPKDSVNMVYLELSDYMFNTAADTAQKHNFLHYNLTAKEIGKAYPNSVVELRMSSTDAPKLSVSASGLTIHAAGNIDMYADVPGRKDSPFLVTLTAAVTTSVSVSIKKELVYGKVGDFRLKLKAGKSAVGPISDGFLDFITKEAINIVVIPKLNQLGAKGFPLPVTDDVHFVNTTLTLAKDTVIIGTDLLYNQTYTNDNNNDNYDHNKVRQSDDTLRFIPHRQG